MNEENPLDWLVLSKPYFLFVTLIGLPMAGTLIGMGHEVVGFSAIAAQVFVSLRWADLIQKGKKQ